ncbi:MAG: hypothetical protein QG635_1424 [Bacteroidota bacterium]|nr:hypothetical protein [Bacteroidota bacterium]
MKAIKNIYKFLPPIVLLGAIIFLFGSCQDTFGTDPDVKITPLNPKDTSKDTPKSKKFQVDKVDWAFSEIYLSYDLLNYQWNNGSVRFNRQNVYVDTSAGGYAIWLDLDIENTEPDIIFRGLRSDRITSARIVVDSAIVDSSYILDGSQMSSGRWFQLKIYNIFKLYSDDLTMNDAIAKLWLNRSDDSIMGILDIQINPTFGYSTYQFGSNFRVKLK